MARDEVRRAPSADKAPPSGRSREPGDPPQPAGDVTRILSRIERGDGQASEQLLPLVYKELRKLAAARMAQQSPGQTLQATALVHEAYIRLVDVAKVQKWDSRGHFFAAAAEAMRRILVETSRAKKSLRRGGDGVRCELSDLDLAVEPNLDDCLDLDQALSKLAVADRQAAELVKLRVFAGMTLSEVASYLGVTPHQAKRTWAYARVWLRREMQEGGDVPDGAGE